MQLVIRSLTVTGDWGKQYNYEQTWHQTMLAFTTVFSDSDIDDNDDDNDDYEPALSIFHSLKEIAYIRRNCKINCRT